MDSRQPVQNLAETIHSLLGLKAHLTSNWVKSVRDIIKNLPPEKSSADTKAKTLETGDALDKEDVAGNAISKLKGNIRVFCRVRPITVGENFRCLRPVVALDSNHVLLRLQDNKSKSYSFDKVFHPDSSQDPRPASTFQVKPQVPHLSSEEPLCNLKVKKGRLGDVTAPLSQLPGFMRSTFCSRRKSGRDLYTVEGSSQVLGRRRRQSSHRAESVTFPVAELITEKPPTMLKDLFDEESRSSSPSASQTTQTTKLTQDFVDGLLLEDSASGTHSSPDMCCDRLDQHEDNYITCLTPIMQAVKFDMQCLDSIQNNKGCPFTPSSKDDHIFDSKSDTGISISISELGLNCQEVSTEIGIKDKEIGDFDDSSQPSPIGTTPNAFKWTSKRALFMDKGHQRRKNVSDATLQGSPQNNGTFHVLKQRTQMVFASALLGFGFHDLGLDHDFFYGLTL